MKFHIALPCLLLFAAPAFAQDTEQEAQEPLKWLTKFVGEWNVENEGAGSGTLTSTMLGDHWVINDLKMGDSAFTVRGLQTIGYDAEKEKYIGTWVDSMTGYMWHYEGSVDDSGEKLILEAEGPSMTDPDKTANYRDAYEFKSADHILATSEMQDDDGEWTIIMSANAFRADDDD